MNEAIREQLSAFVDGELPDNEAELLIRRVSQDASLRREVGNYLAIGRVLRDDLGLAGADGLHERVAAALDDDSRSGREAGAGGIAARSVKPLAGIAIAASVALVALFTLQSTSVDETPAPAIAEAGVPSATPSQDVQRQYFLNHADAAAELGANNINSRLVTLELEVEIEDESADATEDSEPQ